MAFKDPALARASVWQPNLQGWKTWVSRWLAQPFKISHQEEAPPQYDTADFVLGAIRDFEPNRPSVRLQLPGQSDTTQLVAVSYQGCQILADSLFMIVFVDAAA